MRTSTTTKSKTTVYAKRVDTPVSVKATNEHGNMPAKCVPFEDFAKALKKAVKEHYEKI